MIPASFDYHAPKTLAEAVGLLERYRDEAKVLSGGQSLLPLLKLRLAQVAHVVDIGRVPGLEYIKEEKGFLKIGGRTRESTLERSELIRGKYPILADTTAVIADPLVRNLATVGGNLAHGDPANDHPALAMALDAVFVLEGPKGRREVRADAFFQGTYATDMAEDEILVEIRVPAFGPKTGYAYEKLKRKTGDWATAAAAVVLRMDGGSVSHARIALTNLAPTALRATDAEAALLGKPLADAVVSDAAARAMAICDPAEDLRGDRDYKIAMAGQMVRRALAKAAAGCA